MTIPTSTTRFGAVHSYNIKFRLSEEERRRFQDVAHGGFVELLRSDVNGPFFKVDGRCLPTVLSPRQREFVDYLRNQVHEELGRNLNYRG